MTLPQARRDQADGLRRLVGRGCPRILSFASSGQGIGRTTLAVNLAAALAQLGRNVVVVDENRGSGNVTEAFGLKARFELAHVLQGDRPLRDVVLHAARDIAVLPAARGLRMLGDPVAGIAARGALRDLLCAADFVLIDAARSRAAETALPVSSRTEVIITTSANASAITHTYAWIKRLAPHFDASELPVVVCRSKDDEEARVVFGNLSAVAERHLGLRLTFLGPFGADAHFGAAAGRCRTMLELFPRSRASVQVRSLAARLDASRRTDARGGSRRPTDPAGSKPAAVF